MHKNTQYVKICKFIKNHIIIGAVTALKNTVFIFNLYLKNRKGFMKKNIINSENQKMKKPIYKRIWFDIIVVLILIIGGTALTMPFGYGVQKTIIRIVCRVSKNLPVPDNYDSVCDNTTLISDLSYTSVYGNNQMDIISPATVSENLPLFVYIHGGYYVGGDKAGSVPYCRVIANEGYVVANINYIFAPEERYPSQLIQANEAIDFLIKNSETYHIDTDNIFIGGDSAGAHLSGMLGAFYTNTELQTKINITPSIGAEQLKGVVLLCGFYNMYNLHDSKFPLSNDAIWMLTGVKDYENYERIGELNTVGNVTVNYPATYLLCGSDDPFYGQNKEMKAKLEEYNIDMTAYLPVSSGYKLEHEFQREFGLAEADTAMELLKDFLAAQII